MDDTRSTAVYRLGHVILFCERTSLHGLRDIYRSQNGHYRFLWCIIFSAAFSSAIYMGYSVLGSFKTAPTVASYFVKSANQSFPLPDVIVCPFNRFNAHFLTRHNVSNDVAQYIQLAFGATAKHPIQRRQLVKYLNGKRMRELDKEMRTLLKTMNTTFGEFLHDAGLKCEDVLSECNLPNGIVNCCDLATEMLTFSGKCYRIRGFDQAGMGYGYGISVMITLPKNKYSLAVNNWLNDGVVIKLAERNQGVDYDLTFVPLGAHVLMPLKAVKYEFIDDPRFDCLTDTVENYSRVHCFDSCVMETAEIHCGCRLATKVDAVTRLPICTTIQYYYCIFAYLRDRLRDQEMREQFFYACRQRCKPRCSYWQYLPSISYSAFPVDAGLSFARSDHEKRDMKNTIILDVYFENLEYTLVKHVRAMTVHSVIANLGGHYSFWLGGSVITLVQFFVFLVRYLASFCFGARLMKN